MTILLNLILHDDIIRGLATFSIIALGAMFHALYMLRKDNKEYVIENELDKLFILDEMMHYNYKSWVKHDQYTN